MKKIIFSLILSFAWVFGYSQVKPQQLDDVETDNQFVHIISDNNGNYQEVLVDSLYCENGDLKVHYSFEKSGATFGIRNYGPSSLCDVDTYCKPDGQTRSPQIDNLDGTYSVFDSLWCIDENDVRFFQLVEQVDSFSVSGGNTSSIVNSGVNGFVHNDGDGNLYNYSVDTLVGGAGEPNELVFDFNGTTYNVPYIRGAQHDLRLTSPIIERGSDSPTDDKGSAFLHDSYSYVKGFSDNWVGDVNDRATEPIVTMKDNGDVLFGSANPNQVTGIERMFWDKSKGSLSGGNLFGTSEDASMGISSFKYGQGNLLGTEAQWNAVIGSRNDINRDGSASTRYSLFVGDRLNFDGLGDIRKSLFVGTLNELATSNVDLSSVIWASQDTELNGSGELNSCIMASMLGAEFDFANNNRTALLMNYNMLMEGAWRYGMYNFSTIGTTDGNTTTPRAYDMDRSLVVATIQNGHEVTGDRSLILSTRINQTGDNVFAFGNNIENTANYVGIINLVGQNPTAATSSPWNISNSTDRKMFIMAPNGYDFGTGSIATPFATGVTVAPGGSSWASLSMANAKENKVEVDYSTIYKKFAETKISTWNYKGQKDKHIGIMAEDFYSLIDDEIGKQYDKEKIETIDADGLQMALIKSLQIEIENLKKEINEIKSNN